MKTSRREGGKILLTEMEGDEQKEHGVSSEMLEVKPKFYIRLRGETKAPSNLEERLPPSPHIINNQSLRVQMSCR